jgi:hypothetical protein
MITQQGGINSNKFGNIKQITIPYIVQTNKTQNGGGMDIDIL